MTVLSRDGLTFDAWRQKVIQDYLAGDRDALPRYDEFLTEFVADPHGRLPVVSFVDPTTGDGVPLTSTLWISPERMPSLIAEIQFQCVAEWNRQNPARAIPTGSDDA